MGGIIGVCSQGGSDSLALVPCSSPYLQARHLSVNHSDSQQDQNTLLPGGSRTRSGVRGAGSLRGGLLCSGLSSHSLAEEGGTGWERARVAAASFSHAGSCVWRARLWRDTKATISNAEWNFS